MGSWILWLLMGILSLVGGCFAIANPLAATMTATVLAAWIFLFVGILQIIGGFGAEGGWAKLGNILLGVLGVYIAIVLFNNPLQAVLTLTVAVALGFFIGGIFKVIYAFQIDGGARWALILSGVVSVVLAGIIWTQLPGSAVFTLGILLAVELISNGVALIAMALTIRQVANA